MALSHDTSATAESRMGGGEGFEEGVPKSMVGLDRAELSGVEGCWGLGLGLGLRGEKLKRQL